MKVYWTSIEVNFNNKMPMIDEDNQKLPEGVCGFFQEIGCTADDDEDLKNIILGYLKEPEWIDGLDFEVIFDRIGEISLNEIATEIYGDLEIKDSLKGNPRRKGIWYTSGRAFYSDGEGEDIYQVKIQRTDE